MSCLRYAKYFYLLRHVLKFAKHFLPTCVISLDKLKLKSIKSRYCCIYMTEEAESRDADRTTNRIGGAEYVGPAGCPSLVTSQKQVDLR